MGFVPLFTPVTAGVGGLLLGSAASSSLMLSGRVLGISGALKGLIAGDLSSWRVAFLGGFIPGSLLALQLLPGSIVALPATFTVVRSAIAGLLVGLGTAIGNGCTSGHGICGNARLSKRSMAATVSFMSTGALVATLSDTAGVLGVPAQPVQLALPALPELQLGLGALAVFLALKSGVAFVGQRAPKDVRGTLDVIASTLSGLFFSLGLAYTGMTLPAKVVSFLSPLHAAWDPSLAFVMGGALLVALPSFLFTLRGRLLPKPVLTEKFNVPGRTDIDTRLLAGSAMFGAGWGLSGICPGPGLVNLIAAPSPQLLAFAGALAAGMVMERLATTALQPRPKRVGGS